MKYRISPQLSLQEKIYFSVTGNTTEQSVEILFGLPSSDHEGFAIRPQKRIEDVWSHEFDSKEEFLAALDVYKKSWSKRFVEQLNLFLTTLDNEVGVVLSSKANKSEEVSAPQKPYQVIFKKIFPPLPKKSFVCPKCRVDHEKWLTPYNIASMHSTKLDQCAEIQAALNDEKCSICGTNEAIFDYQPHLILFLKHVFADNFFNTAIYNLVGAKTATGIINVVPNQLNIINFQELGVTENSIILDVNLSSNIGSSHLLEMHGNSPILNRQNYMENKVSYWPADIWSSSDKSIEGTNSISVTWRPTDSKNQHKIFLQLLQAFVKREPNEFIMKGSTAIEQLLLQVCSIELEKVPGRASNQSRVSEVLTGSLSYSPQLQYLLPLISKGNNIPPLCVELITTLLTIKKHRDKIAHNGQLVDKNGRPITFNESEFCSFASTFTIAYALLHMIKRHL